MCKGDEEIKSDSFHFRYVDFKMTERFLAGSYTNKSSLKKTYQKKKKGLVLISLEMVQMKP